MFRKLWFQLHWLIGITAGIVLAVMGVTGAVLSFEHDLLRLMNPGVMTVTPQPRGALPPSALIAHVQAAAPDKRIASLTFSADPEDAARVGFAPPPGVRRGETRYLDPYTGELLGQPRGQGFFRLNMQIHRWLAAGDIGKQITAASTVALVVLCLTGLYLRWPRRPLDWRAWLTFDITRKGRVFLWNLHTVAGTWALLLYLLAALTGLYWSYEWYRNGLYALAGVEQPSRGGPPGAGRGERSAAAEPAAVDPDAAWAAFVADVGTFSTATLRLPARAGQPVEVRYLDADPAHERAFSQWALDPASGQVVSHVRYADKPVGERFMSSIYPLHAGSFFGLPGLVAMMIASAAMPLFAITGWQLYLARRGSKKRAARRRAEATARPTVEQS